MAVFMIGYDLNKSGQDYDKLIEKIKSIGTWWHCLDSTWLVVSSSSAVQIRDFLTPYIDGNDELLVIKVKDTQSTVSAAWIGFDTECSNWLSKHLSPGY